MTWEELVAAGRDQTRESARSGERAATAAVWRSMCAFAYSQFGCGMLVQKPDEVPSDFAPDSPKAFILYPPLRLAAEYGLNISFIVKPVFQGGSLTGFCLGRVGFPRSEPFQVLRVSVEDGRPVTDYRHFDLFATAEEAAFAAMTWHGWIERWLAASESGSPLPQEIKDVRAFA